jgi:outer membrane autotransporter protein
MSVVRWGSSPETKYRGFRHRLLAGTALAGPLILATLLNSQPALADCTPASPVSGDTVTCAPPGTGGFAAGVGVNNLTVNVQSGTTVSAPFAIVVNTGNTVTNNGTITAGAIGIGSLVDDNNVINNGSIQVGDGSAIFLNNLGSATNNGTISLGNLGIGIDVADSITIVNAKTITGLDNARGIAAGSGVSVLNSGGISVGAGGWGIVVVDSSTQLWNTGTIVAGDNGIGIKARDNHGSIVNDGTITVGAGASAGGIVLRDNNVLSNTTNGRIFAGDGGTAVALNNDNLFSNAGLLQAGAGGFALLPSSGATANGNLILNSGTIDGRIMLPGVVNAVSNSGLITVTNPGTPVGTIFDLFATHTIGGDYFQTATGTLALRVTADNTVFDRLSADTATLAGKLRAVVQPGLYQQTTTYAGAVTTGCGCVGNFTTVESSSPFLTATSTINGDNVDLTLTRVAFNAAPNLTPNQKTLGGVLESAYSPNLTGDAATFFSNLFGATSTNALDQLSGQGTTGMQTASVNIGTLFNTTMQDQGLKGDLSGATSVIVPASQYAATPKPRGQDAFASLGPADPAATQTGRWRIWTLGFGAYRSLAGNATLGTASQSMHNYGGAMGVDRLVAPDLLLGFSAGGSAASVSIPTLTTTGQVTAGHLGVYGVKTWGAAYGSAAISYARLDNSTTRTITGIGPTEIATGRFASDQLSGRFELGWKQAFAKYTLTPFVAIEPAALWAQSYTESSVMAGGGAGVFGLSFARHTTTSLPSFVGLQADTKLALGNGAVFTPYARLSWVHEFLPDRSINAAFVSIPAATFSVNGARVASDAARLDAGVKYALNTSSALFSNLTGEWGSGSTIYAATVGFQLTR